MSCIINPVQLQSSPSHGIVGRQGCHALIAVQSLLLITGLWGGKDVMQLIPVQSSSPLRDCGEARMSCIINSCTVASPSYGIVGRQGCHALIPVQSLLLITGLWGGKDVMHY